MRIRGGAFEDEDATLSVLWSTERWNARSRVPQEAAIRARVLRVARVLAEQTAGVLDEPRPSDTRSLAPTSDRDAQDGRTQHNDLTGYPALRKHTRT